VVVFDFDGGEKIVISSLFKVVDQGTGTPVDKLSIFSPVEELTEAVTQSTSSSVSQSNKAE